MIKHLTGWLAALAIVAASTMPMASAAKEQKVRYGKSEVDRAIGKCVGSVLGGALLGALIGGLVGGKKGTGAGAAVGATAGAAVCAAKGPHHRRPDRIRDSYQARLHHRFRQRQR